MVLKKRNINKLKPLLNIFRTQMDLQMLLDKVVTVPFHTKNLSYSKE